MMILHRYLFRQLLSNFLLSLMIFTTLFVVFDFFDRIDNILAEEASILVSIEYFLLKIPLFVSLMMPVATLVATLMTIGLLSKNSEVTAMRAAGLKISWIVRPAFYLGIMLSIVVILLNETIVPYAQRRSREIYNIDIRKKDERGGYSNSNFWWREKNLFYSVETFDSRTSSLLGFSSFQINDEDQVEERREAAEVTYVDPLLGWSMKHVITYRFPKDKVSPEGEVLSTLPLPMKKGPQDFYNVVTDPSTMSFGELSDFIKNQAANGLPVTSYYAGLYEKFSFPFVCAIIPLIVIPYALLPARHGSMAPSIIAAMLIGFSYYAVHSFSVAMGRAELVPPLLSAWIANILMALVGAVLLAGAESPR